MHDSYEEGMIFMKKICNLLVMAAVILFLGVNVRAESGSDSNFGENERIGQQYINILLVGEYQRDENDIVSSDCVILLSIDEASETIRIISFLRDLYLEVPGYGKELLKNVVSLGGIESLQETLEENFHLSIDGCVVVKYDQFVRIIDMVGGVEADLSQEEIDFITGRNPQGDPSISLREDWFLNVGVNILNGEQAMRYVRDRYEGYTYNDAARSRRQRNVLVQIFKKLNGSLISELVVALASVFTDMEMTIDLNQLPDIMELFLKNKISELETYRIPADDAYYKDYKGYEQMIIADLDMCRSYLNDILG